MCCFFRTLVALMGVFVFITASPAQTNLITNGSFEVPIVTSGSYWNISPGTEPPGFAWQVTAGNVDVQTAGISWISKAFDGVQYLDLDGYRPGAVAQSFATTPGTEYVFSFAFANNPEGGSSIPAYATVSIFDSETEDQLIPPVLLTHGDSTFANPDWTPSGAITFVAEGETTILFFASNDPSWSDGGIFLDAVSVQACTER